MARQKEQGPRNGASSRRRDSVEDALAATHQRSVPVLPAFGPHPQNSGTSIQRPMREAPDATFPGGTPSSYGTTRQRTLTDTTSTFTRSGRERTSEQPPPGRDYTNYDGSGYGAVSDSDSSGYGSPVRYAGQDSRASYGERGSYDDLRGYRNSGTLPDGVADEVYDVDTYEQNAYSRGTRSASTSRALVPGRPTIGLPTSREERLPATAADDASRQLALHGDAAEGQAVLIRGTEKPLKPYTPIVPKRQGPRSFLSQFIVAMVAVMTIFTVMTLASPLGHSEAFAGTFQTYANAVPWVPTPTPTPKPAPAQSYSPPVGANPGQQAVLNDINAIFGSYASGAINVARCESGFDPNAWNPYAISGSHASGVFQILYPSTWDTTSWAGYSPYNYDANIRAAHQIFVRDGYSWREWSCGIYA